MKAKHIIVFISLFAILGLLLTSCVRINGKNVGSGKSVYSYSDGKKYSVGNGDVQASKVKDLELDWVAGDITITYGGGDRISFSESYKGSLSDDRLMRWYLDGSTLRIKFQKSGIVFGKGESKDLVITVPRGMVLSEMDLNCVSSNMVVDVDALEYEVDTVSGNFELSSTKARKIDTDTVSGDSRLHLGICPDELDADSVSGSIYMWIPENSGFTAEISSVSGKVKCSIPVTTTGKKFVTGDGRAKLSLNSVSGDLNINSN